MAAKAPEVKVVEPKKVNVSKIDVFVDLKDPKSALTDGLCACGQPLAPGQNQVCKDHIRST
jgi:hypothetical protein